MSGLNDLRLVLHEPVSDSYERSTVMLAKAGGDGTLQLLAAAWERRLGYRREELKRKTLLELMWGNRQSTAAAVAAIFEPLHMRPVEIRLRCKDGEGVGLTLHRLCDRHQQMMYILAEESAGRLIDGFSSSDAERRLITRESSRTD